MTRRYFAFTSPAAVQASREFLAQRALLKQQGKAIADAFGGIPVFATTLNGMSFLGLRFVPPLESQLWTAPSPATGIQHPRENDFGRGAARAAAIELRAKYEALRPASVVSKAPVYEATGMTWTCHMLGAIGHHCTEDGIYVVSDRDHTQYGTEISEATFNAAVHGSDV